jgi:hypothetical protein
MIVFNNLKKKGYQQVGNKPQISKTLQQQSKTKFASKPPIAPNAVKSSNKRQNFIDKKGKLIIKSFEPKENFYFQRC